MDWSVGQFEKTFDRGGTPRAWGFEIMGKRRRPLLLFSYASELDAGRAPFYSRRARKSGVRWRAGLRVTAVGDEAAHAEMAHPRCVFDRLRGFPELHG